MYTPCNVSVGRDMAWLVANVDPPIQLGGDSGLPWFVQNNGKWVVVSHFYRGGYGEGPNYAHPDVRPQLLETIERMSVDE